MIIVMGFGSSIVDIVDALRTMQDEEQNKIKDYGDIAKVLESGRLIAVRRCIRSNEPNSTSV